MVKESTKRKCAEPTWIELGPSQWELVPIKPDSRPSFRKTPARAKAKIVEEANTNLRGKILEREKRR